MPSPIAARTLIALAEAQVATLKRGDTDGFARILEERGAVERVNFRAQAVPARVRELDDLAEQLLRQYLMAAQAELAIVRHGAPARFHGTPRKSAERRPTWLHGRSCRCRAGCSFLGDFVSDV